jgi:hypothetical protein
MERSLKGFTMGLEQGQATPHWQMGVGLRKRSKTKVVLMENLESVKGGETT